MPTSSQNRPQLNGKVERSHRSDQEEFYELLTYKDDVDLEAKLDEWERFYNLASPMAPSKARQLTRPSKTVYHNLMGVSQP